MNQPRLPPGQHLPRGWPVLHYGPVPRFKPDRWDLRVFGAVRDAERSFSWAEVERMPVREVVADLHCVTRFSLLDSTWRGVPAAALLAAAPPAGGVTHVMVWAEFGYAANLPLEDLRDPSTLFATHRDGERLSAEHGYPLRLGCPHRYAWKGPKWVRAVEYMTCDRRGFWEERGYHNLADPWREQRYSYQEQPGDGPPV